MDKPSDIKLKVIEILKEYTEEMEGYSYYGSNPGIPEHEYEEIADKVCSICTDIEKDRDNWKQKAMELEKIFSNKNANRGDWHTSRE